MFISAVVIGCGDGGPERGSSEVLPHWRARALASIEPEGPEGVLTRIGDIVIGPDADVYVSQPQDLRLLVFDSSGARVGVIGRQGEGPGEFASLNRIGFQGDTLYVLDSSLRRLNFFTPGGDYLVSRQFAAKPGVNSGRAGATYYSPAHPQEFVLLEDGTALVKAGVAMMGQSESVEHPFMHLDLDTGESRTILTERSEGAPVNTVHNRFGVEFWVGPAFEDDPLIRLATDGRGIVIVDRTAPENGERASFTILIVAPTGDTTVTRSVSYQAQPMTPEVIRAGIDRARVMAVDGDVSGRQTVRPEPTALEEAYADAGLVPRYKIPVTDLFPTVDGMLWIRREDTAGPATTWNAADESGQLLAQLNLPSEERIVAARGNMLVTLKTDTLDLQTIVLYGLSR